MVKPRRRRAQDAGGVQGSPAASARDTRRVRPGHTARTQCTRPAHGQHHGQATVKAQSRHSQGTVRAQSNHGGQGTVKAR